MACLTPEGAMSGDCAFLSANLYARSLFGEDALANLSIEIDSEDGMIKGHVRIRSKTQGIALSLGDRITLGELTFILLFSRCGIDLGLITVRTVAQKENKPPIPA